MPNRPAPFLPRAIATARELIRSTLASGEKPEDRVYMIVDRDGSARRHAQNCFPGRRLLRQGDTSICVMAPGDFVPRYQEIVESDGAVEVDLEPILGSCLVCLISVNRIEVQRCLYLEVESRW